MLLSLLRVLSWQLWAAQMMSSTVTEPSGLRRQALRSGSVRRLLFPALTGDGLMLMHCSLAMGKKGLRQTTKKRAAWPDCSMGDQFVFPGISSCKLSGQLFFGVRDPVLDLIREFPAGLGNALVSVED